MALVKGRKKWKKFNIPFVDPFHVRNLILILQRRVAPLFFLPLFWVAENASGTEQ